MEWLGWMRGCVDARGGVGGLTLSRPAATVLPLDMSTSTAAEPIVTVTENAAREIRAMNERDPENAGKHLRVYVEPGGCSGLQYGMVFDESRPGDNDQAFHGVRVLVDDFSAAYLKGAVVDFSEALTGGGFKITNPNAHNSCGCGKSFEG